MRRNGGLLNKSVAVPFMAALALVAPLWITRPARGAETPSSESAQTSPSEGYRSSVEDPTTSSYGPFRLQKLLPPSVAQGTDINVWGWFSYLHSSNSEEQHDYWNGDVALGITQRFGDRLAATATMHYLNDNGASRGFLEQAFFTAEVVPQAQTLVTVGKFNASFGVEARDAWDRLGGTTSLLFGAEPQDLVGAMLTQPIGATGLKFKPFIAAQFEGHAKFSSAPSGGLLLEYSPRDNFRFSLTNWFGPGFKPGDDEGDEEYDYLSADYVVSNWNGPRLHGARHGLLYFTDAALRWNPRPDLTLTAEALFAATGPSANQSGWCGFLVSANYDITDRWRVFGRWSYLNDNKGLVTGVDEAHQELSVGAGFAFLDGLELRGEYRHDFAASGDLDSVSVHLVFSY